MQGFELHYPDLRRWPGLSTGR